MKADSERLRDVHLSRFRRPTQKEGCGDDGEPVEHGVGNCPEMRPGDPQRGAGKSGDGGESYRSARGAYGETWPERCECGRQKPDSAAPPDTSCSASGDAHRGIRACV